MLRVDARPNRYIAIFRSALQKYCNPDQNNRGYAFGIFSTARHSFSYDEKLTALLDSFKSRDDDNARRIIAEYLQSTTKNNHSFACYFIDELIESDPANAEQWKQFDPKPIVFYDYHEKTTPYLYRGMRLTVDEAKSLYKYGMQCKKADLDMLASTHTWDCGLSTSKSFSATLAYAAPIITDIQTQRALMHGEGWIFEIDASKLQQKSMIDSLATSAARRLKEWERHEYGSWFASLVGGALAASDEEVNVTESIPPTAFGRLFRINRLSGEILKTYNNAQEFEDDIKRAAVNPS